MKCPTCPDVNLVMTDRQGVEIDYCPTCRGVWLDRGELDKIIERSLDDTSSRMRRDDDDDDDRFEVRYETKYDKHGRPYKKSKAKSFFGEIFDF